MLNSTINFFETRPHSKSKRNHISALLQSAIVELGAWSITGVFFMGIVWIAGNIL